MRLIVCAFLAAAVAAASPAAAQAPSEAAVIDAFGKIAFGTEYSDDSDPRLQKWTGPVRWRAYEYVELAEDERQFLDRHIARLARLTGLDFVPAATGAEANFVILFVPEWRYRRTIERQLAPSRLHLLDRLAGTSCLGLLRNHRITHVIEDAVAIIPVERARARGLMRSCIAEETTQVLGLLNDSSEVPGTLFDDNGTARDLTPLDEIMLRLLYQPEMRPGMSRAEALSTARSLLPRLLSPPR
ncbi:MAG: DUF2927 domain-containing protein [Rhodospirillaceae bacterium]|nr:DUF2927 domain-containing protein [Rhodospirillaceae bacterium]